MVTQSVVLFSGPGGAQGERWKVSYHMGGWTAAGSVPELNDKVVSRE